MNIKEELKKLKKKANSFLNSDYAIGYMSAISTVEGIIAENEEKYRLHNLRKNPDDLPKEDGKRYLMYYCGSCVTACGSFIKNFEYAVGWREIEPFEEDV